MISIAPLAIHCSNVVIKSLCGNLDICLNYHTSAYFQSGDSVWMISVVAFGDAFQNCTVWLQELKPSECAYCHPFDRFF